MDAAPGPNVYLEAVEEAQNEGGQFEKAGYPGRQGLPVGAIPDWVIGVSPVVPY